MDGTGQTYAVLLFSQSNLTRVNRLARPRHRHLGSADKTRCGLLSCYARSKNAYCLGQRSMQPSSFQERVPRGRVQTLPVCHRVDHTRCGSASPRKSSHTTTGPSLQRATRLLKRPPARLIKFSCRCGKMSSRRQAT